MTAPATANTPTREDYTASMFEAVRKTAIRDADTVIIDVQQFPRWATDYPAGDTQPVPSVENLAQQFTTTIANGYTRQRRQQVRIWGWIALGTFLVASFFNGVIGDVTVRQNIVGPIGLVSIVTFIMWLVLRSKAKNRTPQQLATINATRDQLRTAGQAAYYGRLRERRAQLLARLAPDPDARFDAAAARAPKPEAQPFGISHEGAEHWCAQWMEHLGATGVKVTQFAGDGGIDIASDRYLAQVKNYAGSVAQAEVRDLAGVAAVDPAKRAPVFLTSGTYPPLAVDFANRANMALFRYDAIAGTLDAVNPRGEALLVTGM